MLRRRAGGDGDRPAGGGFQLQPLGLGSGPVPVQAIADGIGQRHGAHIQRRGAGLDPGQAEQVEDQVVQPVGLLVDLGQEAVTRGRVGARPRR